MKHFLILLPLFLFLGDCQKAREESLQEINLEGEDWGISTENDRSILSLDYNPNSLLTTKVPSNLRQYRKGNKVSLWLRKSQELHTSQVESSLALELGRVYQSDEVYWNGELIGKNMVSRGNASTNYSFGRPRIYPIPHALTRVGENVLVIKLDSDLSNVAGIVTSPVRLVTHGMALQHRMLADLRDLVYIGIYLFISLFFFLSYLRTRSHTEYWKFSLLALCFSVFEFSKNEIRFLFWDNFVFFKWLEYATLLFLPYSFVRFLQTFFQVQALPFQRFYLFFALGFILIFSLIPKPVFWYNFIGYWNLHLIFVFGYAFFLTLSRVKKKAEGSLIQLLALVYLLTATLKEVLIERGFLDAESIMDSAFLLYLISMTLALRFQFLLQKRKLQNRFDRLREADSLREKIFTYMDALITGPLLKMKEALSKLSIPQQKKTKNLEGIEQIQKNHQEIASSIDDIIELARLEVLKEIPAQEKINFVDFVQHLLPQTKITYAIKVDPRTTIETSLDLVNSIVLRLIDFPLFREFSHNDLIITQDLQGNVHFRFLLFHPNAQVVQRVLQELELKKGELNYVRVKWAIISELARLMESSLEIQVIKKRYLKIDLGLPANSPQIEWGAGLEPTLDAKNTEKAVLKKIQILGMRILRSLLRRLSKKRK